MFLFNTNVLKSSIKLTSSKYWFAEGTEDSQLNASPKIGGVIFGIKNPTIEEILRMLIPTLLRFGLAPSQRRL